MENDPGEKTKGLIQLFLGSGGKDGLNKKELEALVGALGKVAKEKLQEKLSEEHTKQFNNPKKKQQLKQLASMLGVPLTKKVLDTKSDDKKNESNNAPSAPVAAGPEPGPIGACGFIALSCYTICACGTCGCCTICACSTSSRSEINKCRKSKSAQYKLRFVAIRLENKWRV